MIICFFASLCFTNFLQISMIIRFKKVAQDPLAGLQNVEMCYSFFSPPPHTPPPFLEFSHLAPFLSSLSSSQPKPSLLFLLLLLPFSSYSSLLLIPLPICPYFFPLPSSSHPPSLFLLSPLLLGYFHLPFSSLLPLPSSHSPFPLFPLPSFLSPHPSPSPPPRPSASLSSVPHP